MTEDATAVDLALQAFVGREIIPRRPGQDPVNTPMIRHWVEAMGLPPAVHLDAAAAIASGRPGVVAPAAMVQAWTMRGYAATVAAAPADDAAAELVAVLAEAGYTSVVATDSDLRLLRELRPGDEVAVREVVESISEEKTTALGRGRFVTTERTYTDAADEIVAVQHWRTLRFAPEGERT